MNILLIDGSPRPADSTSLYLLDALEMRIDASEQISRASVKRESDWQKTEEALLASDAAVFAFPLYVDSIPSHLLRFLEHMEACFAQSPQKPRIYAVVNNGFYEARQNHIALAIMKRWCEACRLPWGQGVGIGAGGMALAAPIGKGPCTNHGKAFAGLCNTIRQEGTAEDLYSEPNFPRFLYKAAAQMGMKQEAKKNGLTVAAIKKRHADKR